MPTYNGHPSWRYWNVSLWINNDEGLYRTALECIRSTRTRREAAALFMRTIQYVDVATPDGAPYSARTVMHAMRGMER